MDEFPKQRPWPEGLETVPHHRATSKNPGETPEVPIGANVEPHAESLTLSSVWSFPSLELAERVQSEGSSGYLYRRDAHPNARSLANKLAQLHSALSCVLTAQGMSAIAAVALSLLRPGSHVWLSRDLYGKTRSLFIDGLGPWQLFSRTFDPTDAEDRDRLAKGSPVDLVVVETISNPRVRVTDLAEIASITHSVGGKLLVDNTFASHLLVRPLELGADLCMESLTKIVSGHSDSMAGMICGRDPDLMKKIAAATSLYGMASSPMDCYLTSRGLATLPLRLHAACTNALALARELSRHASVASVDYPGLESHPQFELARRQLSAFGWMVCLEFNGGRERVERAIQRLAPEIPFCPSLGDVQTTVSHPASTSHRGLSDQQRSQLGISDATLRISCGAEPTHWLCEMFFRALD